MFEQVPGPTLLTAFVLTAILLAVTPGPGVLYIVTRSLVQGRRSGMASVLGELSSILVFRGLNQSATWSDSVTSIPSVNFTPAMTFAR